jgi:hypothetical protein
MIAFNANIAKKTPSAQLQEPVGGEVKRFQVVKQHLLPIARDRPDRGFRVPCRASRECAS